MTVRVPPVEEARYVGIFISRVTVVNGHIGINLTKCLLVTPDQY
jgi:hypothetical protein